MIQKTSARDAEREAIRQKSAGPNSLGINFRTRTKDGTMAIAMAKRNKAAMEDLRANETCVSRKGTKKQITGSRNLTHQRGHQGRRGLMMVEKQTRA